MEMRDVKYKKKEFNAKNAKQKHRTNKMLSETNIQMNGQVSPRMDYSIQRSPKQ